jgi:hypothetical protein
MAGLPGPGTLREASSLKKAEARAHDVLVAISKLLGFTGAGNGSS